MKARNGVWTPWAQVLCVECDYAGLKDSPRAQHEAKHMKVLAKMDRTAEVDRPEGALLGSCDICHCACWVDSEVALLQQVGFKSSDLDWEGPFGWELRQTGGMCAAIVFTSETRLVVVTAMDGEFYVGEYALEDEGWENQLRSWQSSSLYVGEGRGRPMKEDAALAILVEECARQAIEFIRNPAAEAA